MTRTPAASSVAMSDSAGSVSSLPRAVRISRLNIALTTSTGLPAPPELPVVRFLLDVRLLDVRGPLNRWPRRAAYDVHVDSAHSQRSLTSWLIAWVHRCGAHEPALRLTDGYSSGYHRPENAPGQCFPGAFFLVAGAGFEPATSGL